jgi:hypothetical protein
MSNGGSRRNVGALLAVLADDRRRVLDGRLARLRERWQSISPEWLAELERRVDEDDDDAAPEGFRAPARPR